MTTPWADAAWVSTAGLRMKISGMFGIDTVTLRVGQGGHTFTVLEDLLCVSPYFRRILQPRRKAIEGDCPICQDALEGDKEVVFCHGPCGNNFHLACINAWKRHLPQGTPLNCPLCRQRFKPPHYDTVPLPGVEPNVFDIYHKWLYDQAHIRYPSKLTYMIKAYKLGVDIEEPAFSKDMLQSIQKECMDCRIYPDWHDVMTAYDVTPGPSPLREFMVSKYMQLDNLDHILPIWERYPPAFQKDFAKALMLSRGR